MVHKELFIQQHESARDYTCPILRLQFYVKFDLNLKVKKTIYKINKCGKDKGKGTEFGGSHIVIQVFVVCAIHWCHVLVGEPFTQPRSQEYTISTMIEAHYFSQFNIEAHIYECQIEQTKH